MADTDLKTGSSFADLPDVRINAQGETYVDVPEPPASSQPQAAQPATQFVPVPVPMPAPAPQESDADFLRKLTLARQQAEAEARDKWQREAWQRMASPPALPDDDDALTDPKTIRETFRKQAEWAKNLVAENARILGSTISQLNDEAQQSRMTRAEMAAERARYNLMQQGMSDVDNYWNNVEDMLRRDPENYWKIRTNPVAMEQAVKLVRDHMVRSGQVMPVTQPQAPPAAAPYGNATSPGPTAAASQSHNDPGLRRVENLFGIKFKPEDLAKRRILGR